MRSASVDSPSFNSKGCVFILFYSLFSRKSAIMRKGDIDKGYREFLRLNSSGGRETGLV